MRIRLPERTLKKAILKAFTCSRVMLMKIKNVKNLDSKARWFDDIKIVNGIKDLDLKMLWFEKILICSRRLSRAKKWIIESESNEEKRWSDLKFKTLLLSYVLASVFDNIIIIALSNRMLNDSKFEKSSKRTLRSHCII